MFRMVRQDPVWCVWCPKPIHFWSSAGEDLTNDTVSTSLFIYFSLMGVDSFSHAHSGSYQIHSTSTLKHPLY